jgi:hypothetical protein
MRAANALMILVQFFKQIVLVSKFRLEAKITRKGLAFLTMQNNPK